NRSASSYSAASGASSSRASSVVSASRSLASRLGSNRSTDMSVSLTSGTGDSTVGSSGVQHMCFEQYSDFRTCAGRPAITHPPRVLNDVQYGSYGYEMFGRRLTPRDSQLTGRQRALLAELEELFLAEGFLGFTLDDLAAKTRCSKSTLYALAPSK